MKIVVPDYYEKFSCIAEKCRHNCCIGWEIDIDEDTYSLYSQMGGVFGQRLKNGIKHTCIPCFKLDKNERCVFLNADGLCDIILTLGDGALCDICNDHPRFKNFYSDRTEIGLGLCCEEACRIILENTKKVRLITIEDDGEGMLTDSEVSFLYSRNSIFEILQDKSLPYSDRAQKVLAAYGIKTNTHSPARWADIYEQLERLDKKWEKYLKFLQSAKEFSYNEALDNVYENLSVYFVYRHLASSLDDGFFAERLAFCMHAVAIISAIYENCDEDSKDIFEICRMYSAEIEYSDENINKLLNIY